MAVNDAPTLFGLFIGLVAVVRADILVIGGPRNDTIYRFPDMPASEQFGPAIPNEGLEGYLVLASPIQACTPVLPPPYSHNASVVRPWILLIRRGGCDFDAKVINAQNAGYIAAVVYNNGSQNLIPMSGNRGDEVHIPSVFVSYRDGLVLISDCLYMTGDYIVLTPDYPIISLNAILLPFAIVVGICFFVLTMVLVAKYVRDRRRRRRHRLPKSQLKKIPVKKFRKGDGNDVCAICLDEFEEGEKMRVLPCHHQYHCKCVDPWLLNNKRVCPVCKRRVIPGDDSDDEERAGQSSTEPSEHTPLLFSSQTASAPPENDIPVRHPPLLVNVEFLSDDEYDGDSEGSREASYQNRSDSFPSTSRNAEIAPSTSGINHTAASGQLPVLINTTVVADEEEDVALIHLNEYDDGSGKVLH